MPSEVTQFYALTFNQYFNNELYERDRYDKVMEKYSTSAVKVQDSLSFLNFFQNLIFSVALSGVMVMISSDIVAGMPITLHSFTSLMFHSFNLGTQEAN